MRLTAGVPNSNGAEGRCRASSIDMRYILGVLLVILLLLQLRLWVGEGSLTDIDRLDEEIAAQGQANAVLEARNTALQQEVSDLKTGLDSIEEHARSELGLIKQGETYYLLIDKPVAPASPENPASQPPTPAASTRPTDAP
jgi:cell division protein FtsB